MRARAGVSSTRSDEKRKQLLNISIMGFSSLHQRADALAKEAFRKSNQPRNSARILSNTERLHHQHLSPKSYEAWDFSYADRRCSLHWKLTHTNCKSRFPSIQLVGPNGLARRIKSAQPNIGNARVISLLS